jgi:hypothetical protein
MTCPYCSSANTNEMFEYPYPYKRMHKDEVIQHIRKYECECGKQHYYEIRKHTDKGTLTQTYKYGLYQYHGGL